MPQPTFLPSPRKSIQKYKLTLFDKYGPDAGNILQAISYGLTAFGVCIPLFAAAAYKMVEEGTLPAGVWPVLWAAICIITSGCLATFAGLASGGFAAGTWKHLMVSGASTPYQKSYSIQDAMVKQGRITEAIDSFEAILVEAPEEGDAYVRVAELHARHGNPHRALELLRHVQAAPTIEPQQDVYVSYRIVDLYDGPLGDRGRAIVEIRRLIDRHPESQVAVRAREALAKLKAEHIKVE